MLPAETIYYALLSSVRSHRLDTWNTIRKYAILFFREATYVLFVGHYSISYSIPVPTCPLRASVAITQLHGYWFFFPLTKIKSSAKLLLWLPLLLSTEWVTWTHTETILNSFLKQFGPLKEPYVGSQHRCVVRYDVYNLEGRYIVTLVT